jgi:predicted molibdopterin-dependent oxidoreductase YjgC
MRLVIDNREIEAKEGQTVLEAAERSDIYIPHLCSHPELTSYGGCRLCIVEIDDIRGYPTSCTTKAQPGMVVRTQSDILRDMRREILQLILSEHPSGCLLCSEKEECAGAMETIRKVGVTTGCRWCPKDEDCELQRVVHHLEIEEINFPISYQDLEVEKYDPFFDRDYNLCIYCARCVRICEEHRKSFVLALNERGKQAFVGPGFHKTHIEADCEFCGACVSVCPTGALSEKNRKWSGVPSSYSSSICPFCSLNCEIQIATKNGCVIGTFPPGDPHESGGELCVKGRFCLAEMVNHPDRLLEPRFRFPTGYGIVSYEDAVTKAAQILQAVPGKRVAFYLSPNLSLEDYAAVKLFAGQVINTPYLTSSVLDENLISFLKLSQQSIPLQDIEESGAIISILLRGNYAYAPVTLRIKRAAERGVPYYQVGWTRDSTSRFANGNIIPTPGREKQFFKKILQALEKKIPGSKETRDLVSLLNSQSSVTLVLGPEIADLGDAKDILQTIEKIAGLTGAKVFAPNPYGNLSGLLSIVETRSCESIDQLAAEEKIDLLYIIGDAPFAKKPPVDFIIHQGSFPPPDELKADLHLPAATWGEISGSYAGSRGQLKKFKAVAKPPGLAASNQQVLADIVSAMGEKEIKFTQKDISARVPGTLTVKFPEAKTRKKTVLTAPDSFFPYLLIREKTPHAFHNAGLSKIIAGMDAILPEETILLHPSDAAKLGLKNGDPVVVESADSKREYPLRLQDILSPGFVLLLSHSRGPAFKTNPCPVQLRRKHV